MPSVNLIYHSRNHHTEIIAEAIAEAITCEAIDISRPHTLPETDLLFIGTGINGAKPDDAVIDYLDQLPVNKILGAAVFSTLVVFFLPNLPWTLALAVSSLVEDFARFSCFLTVFLRCLKNFADKTIPLLD